MKGNMDTNFIRAKDITLVITILGLLGTLWKYSGLTEIKDQLNVHTEQIAVIQEQYAGIRRELDRIDRNTRG
jgi:hypothetical protein